jgi:hypothetical protein
MKKIQLPAIGGIRKVIQPGATVAAGTTIAELGANTITLAQLAQLITQIQAQQQNTGGGNIVGPAAPGGGSGGTIILGPGLSGGGAITGATQISLTAPIPWGLDDGGGGGDGDPGPPGAAGAAGKAGAQGPTGPAVFLAAEDGQDGQDAIPGPQGLAGLNGATGGVGPMGPVVMFFAEDGEQGDVGVGQQGATGAQGPAGSGIATGIPGTIPDLTFWWSASDILSSGGTVVSRLREWTPWVLGVLASNTAATIRIDTVTLNGLPMVKWPAASTAGFNILVPTALTSGATFFTVIKPATATAPSAQAIVGGAVSSIAFYLNTASGGTAVALVETGVAIIGVSTTSWVAGTAFQANATYVPSTGAFAFRQGRSAAGSGTGTTTAGTANTSFIGGDSAINVNTLNTASLAELIIYDRVLGASEITSVENYIFAKWGV